MVIQDHKARRLNHNVDREDTRDHKIALKSSL